MGEEQHEREPELDLGVEEPLDPEADEQPRLDPEVEARRLAAMSFVRRYGDPVLKSKATPVDRFDDTLRGQVARMAGIMSDAFGVGLAAPQLGISQRLLVYRVGQEAPVIALVNPEVEWTGEDEEGWEEGCLSIPDFTEGVTRPERVKLRYLDRNGKEREMWGEGFMARAMCHETDHLNGMLYVDHLRGFKRDRILKKIQKLSMSGMWS